MLLKKSKLLSFILKTTHKALETLESEKGKNKYNAIYLSSHSIFFLTFGTSWSNF